MQFFAESRSRRVEIERDFLLLVMRYGILDASFQLFQGAFVITDLNQLAYQIITKCVLFPCVFGLGTRPCFFFFLYHLNILLWLTLDLILRLASDPCLV